jgi:hypothetical protein
VVLAHHLEEVRLVARDDVDGDAHAGHVALVPDDAVAGDDVVVAHPSVVLGRRGRPGEGGRRDRRARGHRRGHLVVE